MLFKFSSKRVISKSSHDFLSFTRLAHVDTTVSSNFAAITPHNVLFKKNSDTSSIKKPLVNEQASYMLKTYLRPSPVFVKGKGCYLWDTLGKRYLDLTAGIAVNALGHCDHEISQIISEQATILMHSSNLYHNEWTGALSQLLVQTTLKTGAMQNTQSVFICNSGAEANEAAIKFARKSGKVLDPSGDKYEIVSFYNSFHGRTMGALSATPNPKYQKPFSPMLPGFKYGNYNNIAEINNLVTQKTCGVIVEPIQGEGGINVGTDEFFVALAARCRDVGAVLVYDEIQCGLSRTGSFWAHASLPRSAHPDIITTAKALGNGFPIGATIVSKDVSEKIIVGDHGTTFGGNPLGSRIAHHIVGRLSAPDLLQGVKEKGELFQVCFKQLQAKYPELIKEVRGKGLILGIQLTQDPTPIIGTALEKGLLIISAGVNTLRIVPSLTITRDEILSSVQILDQAMEEVIESSS
ncbi:putative acetylornithine aminotransferase protein [Erysiphe necator]|uniref:acetylornithine transaminase n=1 Tax=Uncinula necator TaxID=52586 RepID=A0A0B1PIH2_UNCNE|nr:putative acetylornithine aminotransferase protein [Erysiphe necator]